MADPIRQALESLPAAEAHIHVAGPEYEQARDAARVALAAEPPAPAKHVATLHVSDFRGYENYDFQHLVDLPPGRYELFTACTVQPPAPAVPDEVGEAFAELERRQENLNRYRDLREALAAEPPAPDPREALAARPLLEAVARLGDRIGQHTVAEITTISDRAAAWLAENPPGQPVAIEPRGCPTPGACSCVEPPAPAPAADGERDHVPGAGNMVPAAYAARLRQCPTHGQLPANAWACPECLRELREGLARLRGSAADGEAEELAQWLDEEAKRCAAQFHDRITRAAALLRQLPPEGMVAIRYCVEEDGAVIQRTSRAPESWAIRAGSACMSTTGEWDIEPMPSDRTDKWLANHRWPSAAAAWAALRQSRGQEVEQ